MGSFVKNVQIIFEEIKDQPFTNMLVDKQEVCFSRVWFLSLLLPAASFN